MYADIDICHVCQDTGRQQSGTLCVVENISDLLAIEKSQTFHGLYHVLGGVLNPLMGIGPDELKIDRLVERVEKFHIKSIILAVTLLLKAMQLVLISISC